MTDRRVAVRYESSQLAPCHYATSERIDCRWAKVHDISKLGIALQMDAAIDLDTRLIVEIPARTYEAIHTIAARVTRVEKLADDEWLLGCVFEKQLSDEEERALR